MIIAKDVEEVGLAIGLTPTERAVSFVLDNYKKAQKEDPTASWDLVVDNLLNEYYANEDVPQRSPCNSHYIEQCFNESDFLNDEED